MGVLTDIKARGVQDILITYTDNLNGHTLYNTGYGFSKNLE